MYKRQAKAAAYLAKHPDDKDSTQKELQEEQEKLLEEIAELKVPLTEVQEDLKKLRDIRYWVRKAAPAQTTEYGTLTGTCHFQSENVRCFFLFSRRDRFECI